eukprot:CAMPEP_0197254882 /NCGR_PEP_ID=MMETSP1429-20130617/70207_1 /TAXON_ID=49237 /ORGANISM="Chaetoceros  sp., Strain UNC1202" /LENGTH=90 /DNA_ID=CAMNT_0042718001 /DNA_START=1 /DNA_END=273 /DNA_ORIENTATION=+
MHRVNCTGEYENCLESTKYMSNLRVRGLHLKQKALMEELGVPYWDLFDAYYLSAYYTAPGDGRHFRAELNEHVLDWFYPNNQTDAAAAAE